MILIRECLRHGIMPFIIQDDNKAKYYMALKQYQNNKDITKLTDYFASEQLAMYDKLQHYMYDYSLDKQTSEIDLDGR